MKTKVFISIVMLFVSFITVSANSLSPEDINVFIQRFENKQLNTDEITKNIYDIDQTAQEVLVKQTINSWTKNEQKNLLIAAKIAKIPSLTEVVSLSRYNNNSPEVCIFAREMFVEMLENENNPRVWICAEFDAVTQYPWPVAVSMYNYYPATIQDLQILFEAASNKTTADNNYFAPELFKLAINMAVDMKKAGVNYKEVVEIVKKQTENPNKKVRKKAEKALSTIKKKTV